MSPVVAVVGAGPAGLACARRLAAAGAAVTVFEKSRGVGGRCATRRADPGPFHHGAPSFGAQGAAFLAEVQAWQAAGVLRPGAAPGSWVGRPTMNALARQMAAGLQVVTETTVTALVREDTPSGGAAAGWQLQLAEAGAGAAPAGGFDAVVVAAPAEQARMLTQASALLQAQLQAVHSEPCWTLMLAWPPGAAPAALPPLPPGGPLALIVDCSTLAQVPAVAAAGDAAGAGAAAEPASRPPPATRWTLHACADWSRAHVEDVPAQAAAALLQALEAACLAAGPGALPLPPPTHAVAHRWRYAQVAVAAAAPFGWDAALRLGCCGDAWQGAAAAATRPDGVERAWLSGVGLADTLLRALAATATPAR